MIRGVLLTKTREKLDEAVYFYENMVNTQMQRNIFKYNLSAFLSASRSITFIMQREYCHVPKFNDWYKVQQEMMKSDDAMKILVDKRDISIHQEPINPKAFVEVVITDTISITESVSIKIVRADGTIEDRSSEPSRPPTPVNTPTTIKWLWYFDEIPQTDIITLANDHIEKLKKIVLECEQLFTSGH